MFWKVASLKLIKLSHLVTSFLSIGWFFAKNQLCTVAFDCVAFNNRRLLWYNDETAHVGNVC